MATKSTDPVVIEMLEKLRALDPAQREAVFEEYCPGCGSTEGYQGCEWCNYEPTPMDYD